MAVPPSPGSGSSTPSASLALRLPSGEHAVLGARLLAGLRTATDLVASLSHMQESLQRIAAALRSDVWPLIEAGVVKPVVDRTFPLVEAAAAHRLMESSDHIGKIILTT